MSRRARRRSFTLAYMEDYEQHAARVAAATRAGQRGSLASSAAKRGASEASQCAALEEALLAWERLYHLAGRARVWLTAREAWVLRPRLCGAIELARIGRALTTLGHVGGLASAGALNAALLDLSRGPGDGRLIRVGPVRHTARWMVRHRPSQPPAQAT